MFSQYAGRSLPEYTLTVDEYVYRLDNQLLSPFTASFGFKTFVDEPPLLSPTLLDEEKYLPLFREHWDSAIAEVAEQFNYAPDEFRQLIAPRVQTLAAFAPVNETCAPAQNPVTESNVARSIGEALRRSAKEGTYITVDNMASNQPALRVNGLPTVSEDGASTTTSNSVATAPNDNTTQPTDRKAAKLNMLKRMRPPPFTNVWTFWHDKYVPPTSASTSAPSSYANRLTLMYGEIHDIKEFYQVYNHTPVENLRQRDSFHLFKRGVKPVWEDPRNVNGGSWTFRVPKEKSTEFWMMVQVIAVGEGFDDVIGKADDICGLSLTTRFTSNLISIWHRNGTKENQKSIDGILDVVRQELPEHLKPKEGSFYYKRHEEHAGFKEVVAAAAAEKEKGEGVELKGEEKGEEEEDGEVVEE
ncbi:hypothetical protein MMC16_002673 [Acarospora aff. strigata]|nr:hypothetical protein [Acarospora aff. strigata]